MYSFSVTKEIICKNSRSIHGPSHDPRPLFVHLFYLCQDGRISNVRSISLSVCQVVLLLGVNTIHDFFIDFPTTLLLTFVEKHNPIEPFRRDPYRDHDNTTLIRKAYPVLLYREA